MNTMPEGAPKLEELLVDTAKMPWREKSLKGISEKMLWRNEETGASIAMIRFAKGAGIPQPHFHASNQFMICLSGKYEYTATGVVLTAGSFYCNPKGNVHGPAIAHEDTVVIEVYDGPHYPEKPSWYAGRAGRAVACYFLRHIARRRAGVVPDQVARDRALGALAGLHLLVGVRQRADRARQHEQPAAERRRKAKLGIDHAGRAIDVHRHGVAGLLLQRRLDGAADRGEFSA